MPTINLGRVGLVPKGDYDNSTTYEKLDIVTYNGASYMAKATTVGHTPPDSDYWQLQSARGTQGPPGSSEASEAAAKIALEAAQNADEKALEAERAAMQASLAEEQARTSAQNANESTELAQTATENANNAASEAREIVEQISSKLEEKVDKVEGKGLSSNDFTNELLNKLENSEPSFEILPKQKGGTGNAEGTAKNPYPLKFTGAVSSTYDGSKEITVDLAGSNDFIDQFIISSFDGTKTTYDRLMRLWFNLNGAKEATPEKLTELCDKWYTLTCVPFHGWIDYIRTGISAGVQYGDFAGMVMEPSTDTFAGRDDFAGHPLFAVTDCNWIIDPVTKSPKITAIDGITSSFHRNSPEHFVGVLQMTGYYCKIDFESNYQLHYSSSGNYIKSLEPLKEAKRLNGDISPWVVHAKYPNCAVNGKMTSCAGVIPTSYSISHNSCHALAKATGEGYSGMTMADKTFLLLMSEILTASMTLDGKIQGCCNYNYQYPAAEAESGVKRIILENDQAKNLEIGSGVIIGNYAGNLDRGQAAMYSISGNQGAIITAIEPKEDKMAVYVNVAEAFDTVANGESMEGTTYISTFLWPNGSCDGVLGNSGSLKNNTSGKYPGKIQGIEYMCGAYSILADTILKYYQSEDDNYYIEPYTVNDASKQANSITTDYKASGVKCKQPNSSGWYYIVENGIKNGISFPISIEGGSSSTYTKDAIYVIANASVSYEFLLFGNLRLGDDICGMSAASGSYGLNSGVWHANTWLSPNGNLKE